MQILVDAQSRRKAATADAVKRAVDQARAAASAKGVSNTIRTPLVRQPSVVAPAESPIQPLSPATVSSDDAMAWTLKTDALLHSSTFGFGGAPGRREAGAPTAEPPSAEDLSPASVPADPPPTLDAVPQVCGRWRER